MTETKTKRSNKKIVVIKEGAYSRGNLFRRFHVGEELEIVPNAKVDWEATGKKISKEFALFMVFNKHVKEL